MTFARNFAVAMALAACAGCATTAGERDAGDPFESANRVVYRFNEGFDEAIARPVASAYHDLLHEEIRSRVRNFFSNIGDLFIGVNNMLQGKIEDGVLDWVRFATNSTFGLLGIHDVASEGGLEKHNEDFGQTFGRWGAAGGPYLVLPILGPSTVRDAAGSVLDIYYDPVSNFRPTRVRNSAFVVRFTNTRADLLDASRLLEEAALDKYVFTREAFLQRRRSLIYDGNPPHEAPPQDGDEQRPAKEGKAGEGDAGAPPRSSPAASVQNIYLPRVPINYDAIMATLSRTADDANRR